MIPQHDRTYYRTLDTDGLLHEAGITMTVELGIVLAERLSAFAGSYRRQRNFDVPIINPRSTP